MFRTSFTLRINHEIDPEHTQAEVAQRIARGVARASDVVTGYLVRFSSGDLLRRRTGMLGKSWSTEPTGDPLAYRVSNRMVQARILEEGGEIVPKNAKALTIPVPDGPALTERGVPRYTSAREIPDLFVYKSPTGKVFLAKSDGRRLELYYQLVQKAEIPPFHYATKAIAASKDAATAEVSRALKG